MDVGPELIALGTAGAQTLVTAMAGDAWTSVRDWLRDRVDRSGKRGAVIPLQRLDGDRLLLEDADADQRAQLQQTLETAWAKRLTTLLNEDQRLAADVRDLIAQWGTEEVRPPAVHQQALAINHSTVNQSAGSQTLYRGQDSAR